MKRLSDPPGRGAVKRQRGSSSRQLMGRPGRGWGGQQLGAVPELLLLVVAGGLAGALGLGKRRGLAHPPSPFPEPP